VAVQAVFNAELGVLPPGDLCNNIAAFADDESLMTQRNEKYRFGAGDLADMLALSLAHRR